MSDNKNDIELFPGIWTILISLPIYGDDRGEFIEVYRNSIYRDGSDEFETNQINVSTSKAGVYRGLHFQKGYQQNKLLTVLNGSIVDIVVNIDPKSDYFGKFNFIHLNPGDQLLVPENIAHGFISLQDDTTVMYQCDTVRVKSSERSIYPMSPGIKYVYDKNLSIFSFVYSVVRDHEIDLSISDKDMNADFFDCMNNQGEFI